MNERKRQAYLEAMDIQTYFPRRKLPGAKSSPAYDFPAISETSELAASKEPNKLRTSQIKTSVRGEKSTSRLDAIEELRSQASESRKATVTPIRQAAESPQDENEAGSLSAVDEENKLSFSLCYYRINEKLAVLDEVPPQASPQRNDEAQQLMRGILKALGQGDFDSLPSSEEFSWPLQSEYSMKNTPQVEAAKAISGFLQMRHETDGFSNLLVFAGQLEEVLLSNDANKVARDFESSKGYFITITQSLASMLSVPALKRDVWQHLQALRKRIAGSS